MSNFGAVQVGWLWLLVAAAAGIALGVLLTALWATRRIGQVNTQRAVLEARLRNEQALEEERGAVLELAGQRLSQTFDALADRSLRNHSDAFLRLAEQHLRQHQQGADSKLAERQRAVESMLEPITTTLARTSEQIRRIEQERHESFGQIREQLAQVGSSQNDLRKETAKLVGALKRPEVRGRWGEITLRRLVELAGMQEHCDFNEQPTSDGPQGQQRPDLVVRLPEDRELVVDVKTPLDAYLRAVESGDDESRDRALDDHARQLRARVRELAGKQYWTQFRRSPEFVVLFLPGDQFLNAALERRPDLIDEAARGKVLLATPTSFIALLKTVAYGWRQLTLAENAETIRTLAEELHRRLATFVGHLGKLGRQLAGGVESYNRAVGSLERQVLPGARKFTSLGIQEAKPIESLEPLEQSVREPRPEPRDNEKPEL